MAGINLLILQQQNSMQAAILRQFNKQGLTEDSEITQHEVKRALDSICSKNTGIPEFDNEVAQEIWNETRDSHVGGGPIRLKEYIQIMVKAESILRQHIEITQQQLRNDTVIQNDPQRKNELFNNLFSYSQDHRTITAPFGLQQIKQSKEIEQSRIMNSINPSKSILFSPNIDEREESTDLKLVFIIALVLLLIDLIVCFQKNHFFTILGILFILCAYILNYFQKKYVLFLLAWTALSFVLDLVWLIINAGSFWNNDEQNLRANIQTPFLRFIVFMVCVEMVLKIVLLGLMFKYRNIGENIKKKVNIFGQVFLLDGRPDHNNLIVQTFTPKLVAVNPFQQ